MSKTKFTTEDQVVKAWPLDMPRPSPNNHKKHTDESVAKLAKSLADIGQIQPIVVDKFNEIIAGHGRLLAAQKLGWSKIKVIQVPVDRETAIKARIADNLMSNQQLDQERLAEELRELGTLDMDFDIGAMIMDDGLADLHKMAGSDDFEIDDGALMTDTNSEIDTFSKEGEEGISRADDEEAPLRAVFGFTKVSAGQARVLKDFIAMVVQETRIDDPAEALSTWAGELME